MDKLAQTQLKWTDKLPIDWRVEKGKHLFDKVERSLIGDEEIITVFRDGIVTLRKNIRTEGFTNAIQEHGYQRIERGDLVIHSMDAFAGAIGISDSTGKGSPVYNVCLPKRGVVTEYYAFVLREIAHKGYLKAIAKGIRERSTDFNFKSFSTLLLPVPPVQEQQAIVHFLDQKLAKIDEYIRKKERMIELLKEQKTSLINEAVTQGLDPDVPKKDSGIDWLGDIPEHWGVEKLKFLASVGLSNVDKNNDIDETQVLLCNYTDVYYNEKINNDLNFMKASATRSQVKKFKLQINDVIITKDSEVADDIAVPTIVKEAQENLVCGYHLALIRPKRIVGDYLMRLLQSKVYGEEFGNRSKGVTRFGLGGFELKNIFITVPPDHEQRQIASFLERKLNQIDKVINKNKNSISKLKEYRQSLISEAVTGKIDCREYMPDQTANADV